MSEFECPSCDKRLHAKAAFCKCGWKLEIKKISPLEKEQVERWREWDTCKKAKPEVANLHLQKMYAMLGRQRRVA